MNVIQTFDSTNHVHVKAYDYYMRAGHPYLVIKNDMLDASDVLTTIAVKLLSARFPRSKSIPDIEENYSGDEFLSKPDGNKSPLEFCVYFDDCKFEEVTLVAPGDSYDLVYVKTSWGEDIVCPRFLNADKIKIQAYQRSDS